MSIPQGGLHHNHAARRFFMVLTAWPKTTLFLSLVIAVVAASFLPKTTRDTRAEAFIAANHPALIYRDKVRETFGLYDPIVVAVVNRGEHGVFNPQTLDLVMRLSEATLDIPGVDPDRVSSLATENDIYGDDFGMNVEPFYEWPPETQEECETIRENVMDFPLYVGSMVGRDGQATLIVAELLGGENEQAVYNEFMKMIDAAEPGPGDELYVAGEGAVSEYLGMYIDSDARKLNPLAGLVITLILVVAYRTVRGMIIPNLVVAGAVAVALGTMAANGVPFYVITNGLPVLLIAIGVSDAIHILSQYYEEAARDPKASSRELTVRSMVEMWRPITFTSITDVAGFAGLSLASFMPPMRAFGIFASVGVFGALLFSMTLVPAALVLLKPQQSKPFRQFGEGTDGRGDFFSRAMARSGRFVVGHSGAILAAGAVISVAGLVGAFQLEVNEERIKNFKPIEPIYKADAAINETMDGTNYLDVVVVTPDVEDLFKIEHLQRIEAMQTHLETLPHVKGTTSIVDFMKQMNRAVNEDRKDAYVLPDSPELVAQYFLLYSASANPTDFEEYIDYDYSLANVRARLDTGSFVDIKPIVEEVERYVEDEFNAEGISGHLAGRANVDYHWINDLAVSHFTGVALALVMVWLAASLSFRSAVAGALAAGPVCMALMAIYAVMGSMGIWLGVGTSMFAAIGIGISVDYSIHTIDRMIALVKEQGKSLDEAFELLYPSTGRALLFNFAAVLLGFGVLLLSDVPPLNRFGALVGVAVFISFIGSMTILPAMIKVIRPTFLVGKEEAANPDKAESVETAA